MQQLQKFKKFHSKRKRQSSIKPELEVVTASTTSAGALLIQLEADFTSEGNFGRRVMEVTPETVRVLDWDDVVSFQIPIEEIASARNEPLIGGGRLEITTKSGDLLSVVTYSQSLAHKFSEAARGIEQLARGEDLLINLKKSKRVAPVAIACCQKKTACAPPASTATGRCYVSPAIWGLIAGTPLVWRRSRWSQR
jgi:hypothetical protein